MTEQTSSPFGEVYMRDPCAVAAYVSAASAPQAFAVDRLDLFEEVIYWPSLRPNPDHGAGMVEQAKLCIEVLAPFVRTYPEAPPEALYRHAAAWGAHRSDPNGYAALTDGQRAAYEVFGQVLLCLDRLKAAAERREQSQNPQIPKAEFAPVEDTIVRPSGGAADVLPMYGEPRHAVITEGTGIAPGHAPARPKPAPAIGPGNIERPPEFMSPERSPAPPAAPAATSPNATGGPGTSPDLGHGFDPAVPFNETGAPPPGQAPASAAETIGASTAIAAEPAAPVPAPDAPANRPQQEGPNGEGEASPPPAPAEANPAATGGPGTSPDLGHGFDPAVPFNATGTQPAPGASAGETKPQESDRDEGAGQGNEQDGAAARAPDGAEAGGPPAPEGQPAASGQAEPAPAPVKPGKKPAASKRGSKSN